MKTRRKNKRPRKHGRKTRSKKQKGGMNDMTAVYIGAGTDIRPIQFLKYIKTFYYFDGQPFSEFGTDQAKEWKDGKWTGKFTDGFSRPHFIPELDTNMTSINMELINTIDNLRIYSDGNQTVHYYTNTALPEHYEKIKNTIRNFDTLLIAGHDPDSIILDAARNKLHFIGFEDTIFHNENESEGGPDAPNSVTNKLHIEEITNRFDKYTYVYNNGTQISFDDWPSFYNFYLNIFNHSRRQNGGNNIGRINTAFINAVEVTPANERDYEVVKDLVEQGADVNMRASEDWNNGNTPLMLIIEDADDIDEDDEDYEERYQYLLPTIKIVQLLIDNGADISAKNNSGWTVLQLTGSGPIQKLLILELMRQNKKYYDMPDLLFIEQFQSRYLNETIYNNQRHKETKIKLRKRLTKYIEEAKKTIKDEKERKSNIKNLTEIHEDVVSNAVQRIKVKKENPNIVEQEIEQCVNQCNETIKAKYKQKPNEKVLGNPDLTRRITSYFGGKRKSRKIKQKGRGVGKSKQVEKPDTPPKKTRKNVVFSSDTKSPSSPKQNKTKKMFISKNKNRSKAVVQYENRKREQDVVDMMLGKIPLEGGNK
jgi:hypothetical protein